MLSINKFGCVVPYLDDVLLLAMENGFYSINIKTRKTDTYFDPEPHLFDNRFNDGKCDPAGRFG